jgi:hypothetical protein
MVIRLKDFLLKDHFTEKKWKRSFDYIHSHLFSSETSRIPPVSAQPKLQVGFRMFFFVKLEVSVTQNSVSKFRLLIPDSIREKFASDF